MRVQGGSMRPTLQPGHLVWVGASRHPQAGDIVAARPVACGGRAVIKRVAEMPHDGEYVLLGDAPEESTDSRSFGPVAFEELLGVVTHRVWPIGRPSTWRRIRPPASRSSIAVRAASS